MDKSLSSTSVCNLRFSNLATDFSLAGCYGLQVSSISSPRVPRWIHDVGLLCRYGRLSSKPFQRSFYGRKTADKNGNRRCCYRVECLKDIYDVLQPTVTVERPAANRILREVITQKCTLRSPRFIFEPYPHSWGHQRAANIRQYNRHQSRGRMKAEDSASCSGA